MADPLDRRDATQRIRIGLTGLAGVLVLVLFAAAVLGLRSADNTPRTAANGSIVQETARATDDTPKDPLAELGVIPGGAGDPRGVAAQPEPAPQPTPQPAPQPTLPVRPAPAPARAMPTR